MVITVLFVCDLLSFYVVCVNRKDPAGRQLIIIVYSKSLIYIVD